jgi:hypothetical protein
MMRREGETLSKFLSFVDAQQNISFMQIMGEWGMCSTTW